jgi:hypothetical protein
MPLLVIMTRYESPIIEAADWHEAVQREIGHTAAGVILILDSVKPKSTGHPSVEVAPHDIAPVGRRGRLVASDVQRNLPGYDIPTQVDYGVVVEARRGFTHSSVAAGVVLSRPGRLKDMNSPVPSEVHRKISQRLGMTDHGVAYINGSAQYTTVAGASGAIRGATPNMQQDTADKARGMADRTALRVAAAILTATAETWGADDLYTTKSMTNLYELHEELGLLVGVQPQDHIDSWYTDLPELPVVYPGSVVPSQ